MPAAGIAGDASAVGGGRRRIAALMTCHNRREHTLRCLESLGTAADRVAAEADVEVFLVDDGCTDGTVDAVAERFPGVRVVPGTGSLYWCGGMRAAWQAAVRVGGFDAYLWLNDDVQLADACLEVLLTTERGIVRETGREGIVVGATADDSGRTTYGELAAEGVRSAGESARPIKSFNGNIVLVPHEVFRKVGGFSRAYTHGFGDLDYAFRANRAGVPIWLAPGHLGTCTMDKVAQWERADLTLWQRMVALHRPTGCPPWELAFLAIRHGGWWFPYTLARLYWRAVFPSTTPSPAAERAS